jgi:hypothetical protein
MNPRVGSGVQQTRENRDGENRQGGEKPRRRNRTCPWQKQAEAPSPIGKPIGEGAGVDVLIPCRWRGDLWKPQERCLVETRRERLVRLRAPDRRENGTCCPARDRKLKYPCGYLPDPNKSALEREKPIFRDHGYKRPEKVCQNKPEQTDAPPPFESVEGTKPVRDSHQLLFL